MPKPDHNQTLTHETEVISFVPQEIADELASQGLREIRETNAVPFDPVGDADKLQLVVDISARKIAELSDLSIEDLLNLECQQTVGLTEENGSVKSVSLETDTPGLRDRLAGEYGVAKTIAIYVKTMSDAMKQRRLLSGQLYGSRMQHNAQTSHMRSTRSIQLSGKNLIEELGKATALRPEEELEMLNNAIPRHRLPPALDITAVSKGHFEPFQDNPTEEEGILSSDLD